MNVLKAEDSEHKEIFMWTPSRESIIWVCDINHPAYTAQTPEMLLFLILRSTQSDCPHLQSSRNFTLIILVSISFYQDRLFSKICPYFQCFNCPFTETHTHTPHTHVCAHTLLSGSEWEAEDYDIIQSYNFQGTGHQAHNMTLPWMCRPSLKVVHFSLITF